MTRSLFRSFSPMVLFVFALLVGRYSSGQEDLTGLEEDAMRAATRQVAPAVVRIETLGGVEQYQGRLLGAGPTTGLIVSQDGYILSSAFGFVGQPSSILVTLPSGQRTSATIAARDESRMLVLLKVDSDEPLPVPTVVPRDELRVGQWTLAVGRTYAGDFPNMSAGILSATDRIWSKAVQTDAKVSPSNYGGPLIDIQGRVIGVLVPLSPQQQGEMAGSQWYDSGIGFAVPLADIMPRLDTMKEGVDLKPGILGVSLKGKDIYSTPATIAACFAKSPAREAGLEVGDTIVEVNGQPIERQAQLRHALGPLVAGDQVQLVAERGDPKQRIEVKLQLVAELEPYVRPELGILPLRRVTAPEEAAGVVVRQVLDGGAAAKAGLQPGDRVTALGERQTADAAALREAIIAYDPDAEVTVQYVRDEQTESTKLVLGSQTTSVPESLPPAHPPLGTPEGELPGTGVVDIKIPEIANECLAYVPEDYDPRIPYGLVVWLHAPGKFDKTELLEAWQPICDQHELILLAPQSADPRRWTSTEIEFIRKAMDDVLRNYSIDPARVVLHGYLAGGAMAYHVAFSHRDVCRAVVPVGAPLPMRVGDPMTDPVEPLAIYSCSSADSKVAEQITAGEKRLGEKKFPVIVVDVPAPERYLNDQELAKLVRWIDSLDRI